MDELQEFFKFSIPFFLILTLIFNVFSSYTGLSKKMDGI